MCSKGWIIVTTELLQSCCCLNLKLRLIQCWQLLPFATFHIFLTMKLYDVLLSKCFWLICFYFRYPSYWRHGTNVAGQWTGSSKQFSHLNFVCAINDYESEKNSAMWWVWNAVLGPLGNPGFNFTIPKTNYVLHKPLGLTKFITNWARSVAHLLSNFSWICFGFSTQYYEMVQLTVDINDFRSTWVKALTLTWLFQGSWFRAQWQAEDALNQSLAVLLCRPLSQRLLPGEQCYISYSGYIGCAFQFLLKFVQNLQLQLDYFYSLANCDQHFEYGKLFTGVDFFAFCVSFT